MAKRLQHGGDGRGRVADFPVEANLACPPGVCVRISLIMSGDFRRS
jgi:hypothetical protein